MKSSTTSNRHAPTRTGARVAWGTLVMLPMLWTAHARAQESAQGPGVEPLASIRAAAHSYIKALLPKTPGGSTVTVGALDSRLRLARCPQPLNTVLPVGMQLQARVTVGVSCPGPVHWTLYVPVTIESTINVLVLSRAVAREAHLTAADVTVETRKTAGPGTAYLGTAAELANRTVRRPLAAGTVLTADMFAPDLIIKRGQEVTLVSSGGSIEVRASGRAMSDGAAGSRIQVQNLSSLRVVEGVVQSADVVEVAW